MCFLLWVLCESGRCSRSAVLPAATQESRLLRSHGFVTWLLREGEKLHEEPFIAAHISLAQPCTGPCLLQGSAVLRALCFGASEGKVVSPNNVYHMCLNEDWGISEEIGTRDGRCETSHLQPREWWSEFIRESVLLEVVECSVMVSLHKAFFTVRAVWCSIKV